MKNELKLLGLTGYVEIKDYKKKVTWHNPSSHEDEQKRITVYSIKAVANNKTVKTESDLSIHQVNEKTPQYEKMVLDSLRDQSENPPKKNVWDILKLKGYK